MIPAQLLFLSFILIVLVLFIFIALDINLLSRFFAREESWPFIRTDSHLKDVKDINQQINLKEHVGRNLGKNLIRICPVNAINYSHQLEEPIKIEEKQCLGYSCRECLRLVLSRE